MIGKIDIEGMHHITVDGESWTSLLDLVFNVTKDDRKPSEIAQDICDNVGSEHIKTFSHKDNLYRYVSSKAVEYLTEIHSEETKKKIFLKEESIKDLKKRMTFVTVKELCECLNLHPISEMNDLLLQLGLQEKFKGLWVPTKKGKKISVKDGYIFKWDYDAIKEMLNWSQR